MEHGIWKREMCEMKLRTRTGLKLKGEMEFANCKWGCETKFAENVEFVMGCVQERKKRNGNGKLEIWVELVVSNPNLLISCQHLHQDAWKRSDSCLEQQQLWQLWQLWQLHF